MRINSSRVSLALSVTALFVALGGTALAVSQIGTKQIKNGAVTTSKLHDKAVTNAKLARNSVGSGKVKDHSLTATDVAPKTFLAANGTAADSQKLGGVPANQYVQGLGFAPMRRLVLATGGSGITIFSTGFGTFSAACSNSGIPTVSYTPDRNGENFEATVTSDGGSPITKIDTQNAIGSGVAHQIDNSAGGRQSISVQVGYTDVQDHVATGTITSQFLFGTGCVFMAQGLSSG